ncbi:MAG: heme exporter protein CcmD [Caulobacteraceae bacterium]|nr:heme exporter protein CcmD [Caulobacteraceae bacterium]
MGLDFAAGNYAAYVWPSYALTALIFAVLIIDSLARARRWKKAVETREREAREAGAAAPEDEA